MKNNKNGNLKNMTWNSKIGFGSHILISVNFLLFLAILMWFVIFITTTLLNI